MDQIAEIRRRHFVSGEGVSEIARALNLSRPTVRKHLKTLTEPTYRRQQVEAPRLEPYKARLDEWLAYDAQLPRKQRCTARRLFERLRDEGYDGAYDSVQRFVKQWKINAKMAQAPKQAFVPLTFPAGTVGQFDWSQEIVELGGEEITLKVAQFRLAHSRKSVVVAYLRETLEMVMDAHNQAFTRWGGVPKQMVYDNLTTVVDKVLQGKNRHFNRRFMALANHYLFEPVACTPAAGWEKGQVENQVGNIREWFFTPRLRFETLDDLNQWLAQRCEELAERPHPEYEGTIAEWFAHERPHLLPLPQPFDGYVESMQRVSSTCLIRHETNQYSVPADYANLLVSVRVDARRIRVVANEQWIAEHSRHFGRKAFLFNPWHYLPVLERKPGALRHGAPFTQLPNALNQVRQHLLGQPGGDCAFVELLLTAREVGIEPLQVACEMAIADGMIQASLILNTLRRLSEPLRPQRLDASTDESLTLSTEADVQRYDHLLGGGYVH